MKNFFFNDFQRKINPNIRFLETPHRESLVRSFIKYLRDNNKVVIELDRVLREPNYNQLFLKIHLVNLFNDPRRFVAYQSGIGFYSETTELKSYMLYHEKFFPTYFHLLFNKLENCSFCWNKDVKIICMYCKASICSDCFYDWTSYYFTYNNQFRCRACQKLNWWKD